MSVYSLRALDGTGPVKIGSSRAPQHRLRMYLSWSPKPLAIIAQVDWADVEVEFKLHHLLSEHRSHHEWFHPTPEVMEVVDGIVAGTFDWSRLSNYRSTPDRVWPLFDERRLFNQRLIREANDWHKRTHQSRPREVREAMADLNRLADGAYDRAVRVIKARIAQLIDLHLSAKAA